MSEETYDQSRARQLEGMLRALGEMIRDLDSRHQLLANPGELMRIIGDVKSELFHYEVRVTYDTPEVAESRRIVSEIEQESEQAQWQAIDWNPDEDDKPEW